MIGKRLGHYLVLERLGGGGMGEVYVAEDTTLGRKVALKLPRLDAPATDDRAARFRREARAAAALNHPNIVHLYSVEEWEGLLFITMELVPGRSLRALLRAGAPLPVPQTLAIASQLAEGLACAHAAGILHRDLKPANVMVMDGDRVKILDFGLAKFFSPAIDPEAATIAGEAPSGGLTLGTAGYMSPEQALGQAVDARTDLFALGAVLFELATGRPPFAGHTLAATIDQLLNRRPPAPHTLNPALPADLSAVIERALEKDPERRHRSAPELLAHLRGAAGAGAPAASVPDAAPGTERPASIVVLPFVDMSPQKDQEYFCQGVAEEIISRLARVSGLRVISRTSAFAFQGMNIEITEIGRRLRVGTALEGSVRKAGDRVRVTAQLVDTGDGRQIWSRRFDRELADVFAIQDEIAATIVEELRSGLASRQAERRTPSSAAAHDAYLRGLYALNAWTESSVWQAIEAFRDAIALDPEFAPPHAAIAEAYLWLYSGVGLLPAGECVPHARRAVDAALALDPGLADAHRTRALLAMNHDWDRVGAREGLARALALGPGSAAAHLWNAWRLVLLERQHDAALGELDEARRLDPLDPQVKTLIGYVHHFRHDFDRALRQFEEVAGLHPSFAFARYAIGDACTQMGRFDRAFGEYEKAIELGGPAVNHLAALGYASGRAGRQDRAGAILRELTTRAARTYVAPMWIALVHLGLGDLDALFAWLDRAFEARDGSLILITAAVEFDPVRRDPRFLSLLGRMGLGTGADRAPR